MKLQRLARTLLIPGLLLLASQGLAEAAASGAAAAPAVKPTPRPRKAVAPTPTSPSQAPAPTGAVLAPTRQIPRTDLALEGISTANASSPLTAGGTVRLELAVANRGQAGAVSSTCHVFANYMTRSGRRQASLATMAVPALSPGGTDELHPSFHVPADARPGTFEVWAMLDPEYAFNESDEGNNSKSTTLTVLGPDLEFGEINVTPGACRAGESLEVSMYVRNTSGVPSPETAGRILLSPSRTMTSVVVLGQWTQAALSAGGIQHRPHTSVTIPAGMATGTYYIGLVLDPDNAVGEEDERNNSSDPILFRVTN